MRFFLIALSLNQEDFLVGVKFCHPAFKRQIINDGFACIKLVQHEATWNPGFG